MNEPLLACFGVGDEFEGFATRDDREEDFIQVECAGAEDAFEVLGVALFLRGFGGLDEEVVHFGDGLGVPEFIGEHIDEAGPADAAHWEVDFATHLVDEF